MEGHPVLGRTVVLNESGANLDIYTRTVVLWGINLTIDTERLWQNIVVLGPDNRPVWSVERANPRSGRRPTMQSPIRTGLRCDVTSEPIVRMVSNSTHRRGYLPKRLQTVPFRSVLSVDVEHRGVMPNLKLSNLCESRSAA